MKKLYLNIPNTFTLDSSAITDGTFKVQMSLIGEDGTVLLNADGDKLIFSSVSPQPSGTLALPYTSSKFTATFTLATATAKQYARAYWAATTSAGVDVVLTGYTPEELSIESSVKDLSQAYEQMVCPASYFTDSFLGALPSMSRNLVNIIAELNAKNPDIIKNELLASQYALEQTTRIKFFKTPLHMVRDFYSETFRENYWIQQTDWVPIVSVETYKLVYGNQDTVLSGNVASSIVITPKLGTLEWLPTSVTGNLFTMLLSTMQGIAATMIVYDNPSRVPALFRIDYTAGLDFPNLPAPEKENIRRAVCRNAFMALKPRIDPIMRERSISKSIDGANKSTTGGMDSIIKQFKEDERQWISGMRMEYGTGVAMGIV